MRTRIVNFWPALASLAYSCLRLHGASPQWMILGTEWRPSKRPLRRYLRPSARCFRATCKTWSIWRITGTLLGGLWPGPQHVLAEVEVPRAVRDTITLDPIPSPCPTPILNYPFV